jgi:catechol 2,3-dioxygenase-like lactoylglutathione lyase family enzyme
MQIQKFDHVNIRTSRLDELIEWYTQVLGLKVGFRPPFSFPGAWLYLGDTAYVHLVGRDGADPVGSEVELKLEHFAFRAKGAKAFEESLIERGEKYRKSEIEATNTVAINVWDPDGNHIHVDFFRDE